MTLQMLQYFLSIVRTGSFTKAAKECYVTQPALSRAIRELETELGGTLFYRTSRSVELTEAGKVCLVEAERIMNLCLGLPDKVAQVSRAREVPLRLGYIIYDQLMCFMEKLGNRSETLPLETRYYACSEAKKRFRDGELDALILPSVCASDLENIENSVLSSTQVCAVISRASPFFDRDRVDIRELRECSFIGWNRDELPLLQSEYESICRASGFEPDIIGYGSKFGDVVAKVRMYNAVGFISTVQPKRGTDEFRIMPLDGVRKKFGLSIVWHRNSSSLFVQKLAGILNTADQ